MVPPEAALKPPILSKNSLSVNSKIYLDDSAQYGDSVPGV